MCMHLALLMNPLDSLWGGIIGTYLRLVSRLKAVQLLS